MSTLIRRTEKVSTVVKQAYLNPTSLATSGETPIIKILEGASPEYILGVEKFEVVFRWKGDVHSMVLINDPIAISIFDNTLASHALGMFTTPINTEIHTLRLESNTIYLDDVQMSVIESEVPRPNLFLGLYGEPFNIEVYSVLFKGDLYLPDVKDGVPTLVCKDKDLAFVTNNQFEIGYR